MSGITSAQAQSQLDAWMAASTAVATGQSYRIGDRMLTRADAGEIRQMIEFWDRKFNEVTRGGIRVRGITPAG